MSWYRDTYLKSEDWKNLRSAILAYQDYICECCGGVATDAHHLMYRKIWNVTHYDLMACCRDCHVKIHEWLETPEGKALKKLIPQDSHPKKTLGLKGAIANHVSPRGFVNFKPCWSANTNGPGNSARVTFYSKNLKEQNKGIVKQEKKLKKALALSEEEKRLTNKYKIKLDKLI